MLIRELFLARYEKEDIYDNLYGTDENIDIFNNLTDNKMERECEYIITIILHKIEACCFFR